MTPTLVCVAYCCIIAISFLNSIKYSYFSIHLIKFIIFNYLNLRFTNYKFLINVKLSLLY